MEQPIEGALYDLGRASQGRPTDQGVITALSENPRVFSREWVARRKPEYAVKFRQGSDLIVISALHHQLNAYELEALSRFRLKQYVNAEFYDADAVKQYQITTDPAMAELAPYDYHAIIATAEGEIACYMCLQTPILHNSPTQGAPGALPVSLYRPMWDVERPQFPTEIEFGTKLYGQHQGIRSLPAASLREISTLIRNITLARSVATDIALVETILLSAEYVMDVRSQVEAVIGCIAPDARRVLYNLGIPMTYAPDVRAQALPYASPFTDPATGRLVAGARIWAQHAYEEGLFWPFALATADIRLDTQYFIELERVLAQAEPDDIWAGLRQLRHNRPLRVSRYLIASQHAGDTYWTKEVSPQRVERARAQAASRP